MPAQPNKSLINGLTCLQMLVSADKAIGSREMARILGLEHTRVNRLLGTLAHIGLVEQTPSRKYRPGPAIHVLAAQSLHGSGLLSSALPHLTELRDDGLMVALGVLWKRHVCYLFSAQPGERLERAIGRHELFPVEKSSIGLVLLAGRDEKDIREFLKDAKASGEPVDKKHLERELRKVRKQGFSVVHLEEGHASISVAIGKPAVAGVALAGDVRGKSIPELVEKLKRAAGNITADMHG